MKPTNREREFVAGSGQTRATTSPRRDAASRCQPRPFLVHALPLRPRKASSRAERGEAA
jgi:hypothetical protein